MLNITLLGSGGGMPVPERFLSSLIFGYRGRKVLIDCGEGTQVAMRVNSTGFKSIDIIAITQGHGDHILGLPGLLATIGNSGRIEPIIIIGPYGIKSIIEGLRAAVPYLPYELNIIEDPREDLAFVLRDGRLTLLPKKERKKATHWDITLETLELHHSAPCLGFSFYINRRPIFDVKKAELNKVPKILWNILQKGEGISYEGRNYEPSMVLGLDRKGIKLSFITDTRPHELIEDFVRASDLMICEGTYGSDDDIEKAIKNRHMTFREAAAMAHNGEVKQLVLTHFSPAMVNAEEYEKNAAEVFENTIIGKDGLTLTLSFK